MSVELIKEVWVELKRHINSVDRNEAADTLVAVLVDNDVDVDDIKDVFKSDTEVKRAVASYLKDHDVDDEEDEDEDDFVDYDEDFEDEDY